MVSIRGGNFYINGRPTYAGRSWQGHSIEGLLFNSRMVQGIFDDLDASTAATWDYPDTHRWDPERNTNEFVAAMPDWRRHGLLAFTLNLQGGSPTGYTRSPLVLENSAFAPDGALRPAYMARLSRILDRADSLGMVVILGYFYTGQVRNFTDEAAVIRNHGQRLAVAPLPQLPQRSGGDCQRNPVRTFPNLHPAPGPHIYAGLRRRASSRCITTIC